MNALQIKKNRKELGLTQKELAGLVGVSTQTINGYENGKEIPSTKYQILEKVLKVETSNILKETEIISDNLIEYNIQIEKIKEKIVEHEKIIILAKNNHTLFIHHTEMVKLLKIQIEMILEAKINHQKNI